jgi:glyoxylase-like metal-dependent hydrolase (beta-lactamase superfamily II)
MRSVRLALGETEIFAFSTGTFEVDGREMFGGASAAARTRTSRRADESRYPLALNSFLIKTPGAMILADTGIGALLDPRYLKAYKFRDLVGLPEALSAFGFSPGDIDIVFNSHLHFDHCGGNVRKDERGALVPAFPRARYVVQRGEWTSALHPIARDRQSYLPAGWKPLADSGLLELVDGETDLLDGVQVFPVPGHTEFHQCLKVASGGRTFVVPGDLVPTSAHARLDSLMSFDVFPAVAMETKQAFNEQALAGNWLLGFSHDPEIFFGRLRKSGSGFEVDFSGPH